MVGEDATSRTAAEIAVSRSALEEGVRLSRQGRHVAALGCFEDHIHSLDAALGEDSVRHVVRSHFGLCMALVHGRTETALGWCAEAVEVHPNMAELRYNLGMVLLRRHRRGDAIESFQAALSLEPGNERLAATLQRMQRRHVPFFRFLSRSHLLNRLAGRVRHLADPARGEP